MSDSRWTRLRVLALAAGCVAVLGLAACGGGSDTSSTSSTTTTQTGATGSTSATSTTGGVDPSNIDAGALRDQFNQQLITVLTTQQGLTDSQAQCAIDELQNTVSDQELQDAILQAAQTGKPPQSLIDAGFAAGQKCANQ
jgi:hypothetical protein